MGGYAVSWNGIDGGPCAGRLDVGDDSALLAGAARGRRAEETIAFADIADLELRRGRLHVGRHCGRPLSIVSLDGPGALRELADRLVAMTV